MSLDESKLVFDWDSAGSEESRPLRGRIELNDETLRDGLQSPSVRSPRMEDRGVEATPELVDEIFKRGKRSQTVLADEEIRAICRRRGVSVPDDK